MNILVVGSGSWGTALSIILGKVHASVTLLCRTPHDAAILNESHENAKYLPGIHIPSTVLSTADVEWCVPRADCIVIAVPSEHLPHSIHMLKPYIREDAVISSAVKGFEPSTLNTMSQVIANVLGPQSSGQIVVLSGPTIARECAEGLPAAAVVAGGNAKTVLHIQKMFQGTTLRTYVTDDTAGVEIGGAVKNIIAIAAGICDGLEIGDNGKAAIITRGLTEMVRFGMTRAKDPLTFAGLSGLGDCLVTCMSPHSRNRRLGEAVGSGKSLDDARESLHGMVAEGVLATRALVEHSGLSRDDLPITFAVHDVLFAHVPTGQALEALLQRTASGELRGIRYTEA
ncbi:MAG: NAD(P)H-dependent glycerol-3-phosphate dehydrogenase [Candidatus Dormibacteria bacterium]